MESLCPRVTAKNILISSLVTCVNVHSSYLHKGCRKPNYCSLITIHVPNGFSWHFYTTIMFVYLRSDSDPMTQFTKRDFLFSSQNRKMRSSDGASLWLWCPPKVADAHVHIYIYICIFIFMYLFMYLFIFALVYLFIFMIFSVTQASKTCAHVCNVMYCNVM